MTPFFGQVDDLPGGGVCHNLPAGEYHAYRAQSRGEIRADQEWDTDSYAGRSYE